MSLLLLPEIETERLLLRMYQTEELKSVYNIITDKDVTKFFPSYYSVEKADVLNSLPRRIKRWQNYGFGQLGVFDKTDEKLIGYCGLQPLDDREEIEIYYGFYKNFWGRGLATEAAKAFLRFGFENADLPKIVAVTHPENFSSQKVLLKLGMKQGENIRVYDLPAAYFSLSRDEFRKTDADLYKIYFTEIDFND